MTEAQGGRWRLHRDYYHSQSHVYTNRYPDLLQPLGSGYPSTVVLRANHTRAVHIGLNVPVGAAPGDYKGSLTVTSDAGGSTTTDIVLTVWPIAADCVAAEIKSFGAAYGFSHDAVTLLYPDRPGMHATMREFTNRHHVSSNSLDLWQDSNNVTIDTIAELLQAQGSFFADAMYLTPTGDAKYMEPPVNKSWVRQKVDAMDARMAKITGWGVQNRSIVYGPDELPGATAPGINLLFGEVKRKWPETQTLAVINWPAQAVMESVDILVFQYQELQNPAMAASRDAYVEAGKHVWGYHCVSPTPNAYLNSFVDVPLMKQRLIPWLASQSNLTGWLYWYINYGWEKGGPNDRNLPLQPLQQSTGYSDFNVTAANGEFWTNSDGEATSIFLFSLHAFHCFCSGSTAFFCS